MLDFFIHSPIAHFAEATPQHPALSFNGEEMSYRELDAASSQLANRLIADGLRAHDRVGIFMRKSLDLGVAIYGILKAGGVFVPLDPFMPVGRLDFILRDCSIEHLVSAERMVNVLSQLDPSLQLRVYGVGDQSRFRNTTWEQVRAMPATSPEVSMIDQDLAYIMYTSGSTGFPKGMMHTHHGSISYARWGALHVGLHPQDRVASHAPLHFDLSIFDFFSTAQAGATVVLVPEAVTRLPASWTQHIETEGITCVFTVPFALIEMLERGAMEHRDLSSLRWILFGGEPFPPKHLRALMEVLPGTRFTNVYGPAEAPSCVCYDVPTLPAGFDEPVPIGNVSRNSAALILDDEDNECPNGVAGELCIRSSTLTKGYWNRPDLNERAFFLREGFGTFPDVFYRTGDVVVRHDDGLLRFLGRRDRMIKTRGHRVELDEVEAALSSHPSVSEAAAFAVPDDSGSNEIRAVVKLSDGETVEPGSVIKHAAAKLPQYAVPLNLVIVDEFPRTTSGKIDRRQLAEQAAEGRQPG